MDAPTADNSNDRPKRSQRGRRFAVAVALTVVVAGLTWAVYRATRPAPPPPLPPAPRGVVVGVPGRRLRFAAYNLYHNYRGRDRTIAEVQKLDPPPDFLLLSEVDRPEVRPMADALGMHLTYYPLLGYARGEAVWPDVAILSRHPLHDGRPLFTDDGHTFGLWATAVVDDRKFAVAGVHLWPTYLVDPRHVVETANNRNRQLNTILRVWREAGAPPLVVAGDFNQPAVGENYALMTREMNDTLALLGETGSTFGRKLIQLRIDYVLATPHWEPVAGGVVPGKASDHRPVWADLKAAPPGAATRPATAPATRAVRD